MLTRVVLEMVAIDDSSAEVRDAIHRAWLGFAAQRGTCTAISQDHATVYEFTDTTGSPCVITTVPKED